ncbi:hypothetical protein LNV09_24615, partial [Paucibacter sp. B2R-40]
QLAEVHSSDRLATLPPSVFQFLYALACVLVHAVEVDDNIDGSANKDLPARFAICVTEFNPTPLCLYQELARCISRIAFGVRVRHYF